MEAHAQGLSRVNEPDRSFIMQIWVHANQGSLNHLISDTTTSLLTAVPAEAHVGKDPNQEGLNYFKGINFRGD